MLPCVDNLVMSGAINILVMLILMKFIDNFMDRVNKIDVVRFDESK